MKNPNDAVGNRIRDFSACIAVPQPTASEASEGVRLTAAHYCITSLKLGMNSLFTIGHRLQLIKTCQVWLYIEEALARQHSSCPSVSANPRAAFKNAFRNAQFLDLCSRLASTSFCYNVGYSPFGATGTNLISA